VASPPAALAADKAAPLVFAARVGNSVRLAAVSPAAAALGLAPGLSLADARARVPELTVAPNDPAADAALLHRLARRCRRFTPTVVVDQPDVLLLDLLGVAHPAGGQARFIQHILGTIGAQARPAFARNPAAAAALARAGVDEVAALPVSVLGLEAAPILARAGLHCLGAVAARPRPAIAARIGPDAAAHLARLLGEAPDPRAVLADRPHFRVEQRLVEPIHAVNAALGLAERLLARLARRLARAGRGGRRFVLTLDRADGRVFELAVETGRPTRDPAMIARLFAERLDGLADPLDPGFGFERLCLSAPWTEPLAPEALVMDSKGPPDALQDFADRFAARHGAGRLGRLVPLDRHVPEAAEALAPAGTPANAPWPSPPPGEPPRHPLFLFCPPEPVLVLADVPDGPPRQFRWRRRRHEVVLAEGPERIAPEWWHRRDGALEGGLTRDYYRVEDVAGARFWIFRHGLYGRETAAPRWFLHGLFA
jgi:protein ImuB